MSDISKMLFDERSAIWRFSGRCALRDHLFSAVCAGDIAEVNRAMPAYIFHLMEMIGEDYTYASSVIQYLWIQLGSKVHATEKFYGNEVYAYQQPYYDKLSLAGSVADLLGLYQTQIIEFTNAIAERGVESKYRPLTKRCKEYIKNNLYSELSIQQIADEMHFSRSYVSHVFKEDTGMALDAYIRQEKVTEAKKLLSSNMPMQNIALLLCYASQSHFSQVFKKETGMTPKQFRAQERT